MIFLCAVVLYRGRMRGTRRSGRLTGAPPEDEDMDAHLPVLQRATSDSVSREGTSRDPRRSVDESRRGVC